MAKKVRCIECDNSMDWAIPKGEHLKDSYTQRLLKNTIVCGYTMKTKSIEHCQYCKHYEHEEGIFNRADRRKWYEDELQQALSELN
jgi:hypothetical protein